MPAPYRRLAYGLPLLVALVLSAACSSPRATQHTTTVATVSGSGSGAVSAAPAPALSDEGSGVSPIPPGALPGPAAVPPTPPAPTPGGAAPAAGSLAGRTVVLDAGHNGGNAAQPARLNALVPAGGFTKPCNTAGTETNAGYPEHAFTFDVVHRAALLLTAAGAHVVLTRNDDTGFGPCVNDRAAIGNTAHADAVVAVHGDGAVAGHGFHVIAPGLAPDRGNAAILTASYRLALDLRSAFQQATGEPYATYTAVQGLTTRTDLAGLNLSRVPAVFIECGNMRDPTDAGHMTDPGWRQDAAAGVVAAVEAFLHP